MIMFYNCLSILSLISLQIFSNEFFLLNGSQVIFDMQKFRTVKIILSRT